MPVKFIFKQPSLRIWMLMHQTLNSVSKCEDKKFAEAGLTYQQYAILTAIKYSESPATPTTIADWVDRHLNSVSLILNRMEKRGLVKRIINNQDRRSFRLVTTEKGDAAFNKAAVIGWNMIQELIGDLSEEEICTMSNLLEKIRNRAIESCYEDKNIKEVNVAERCDTDQLLKEAQNDNRK